MQILVLNSDALCNGFRNDGWRTIFLCIIFPNWIVNVLASLSACAVIYLFMQSN